MTATRPNQNTNGQAKQPSMNPQGQASPGAPGQAPSTAPHSALKSNLAHPPLPPMTAGGTGGDLGMLQTRVNYRDLSGPDQAQVAQQMGIDPYAMLKMGQQQVDVAAQQGQTGNAQQGLMPNSLSGPGIDPNAGLDNFPHDMNALLGLMQRGYAPGADAAEHAQAQNAHATARAMDVAAQQQAQNNGAHADATQALGALFQKLHLLGQLPAPGAVANHVATTYPSQFAGSAMMGGAAPGGAPVNATSGY